MKLLTALLSAILIFSISAGAQQNQQNQTKTEESDHVGSLESAESVGEEDLTESPQPDGIGTIVTFETPDGKEATGYLLEALVDSDDFLFIIHEWSGLNEDIKKLAEKYYADLGTVNVLVLDLYDGKISKTSEDTTKYREQLDEGRAKAIIEGALDLAGNSSEIATVGWNFGGWWALQAAMLAGSEAQGAVLYYGNEENNVDKIEGEVPFPVMAIIAERDDWKDPEVVKNFERDLREAAKELVIHFYEADRQLDNPHDPTADMEATNKAYKQSLFFLKRALD